MPGNRSPSSLDWKSKRCLQAWNISDSPGNNSSFQYSTGSSLLTGWFDIIMNVREKRNDCILVRIFRVTYCLRQTSIDNVLKSLAALALAYKSSSAFSCVEHIESLRQTQEGNPYEGFGYLFVFVPLGVPLKEVLQALVLVIVRVDLELLHCTTVIPEETPGTLNALAKVKSLQHLLFLTVSENRLQ